jgi:hypothetical protein
MAKDEEQYPGGRPGAKRGRLLLVFEGREGPRRPPVAALAAEQEVEDRKTTSWWGRLREAEWEKGEARRGCIVLCWRVLPHRKERVRPVRLELGGLLFLAVFGSVG